MLRDNRFDDPDCASEMVSEVSAAPKQWRTEHTYRDGTLATPTNSQATQDVGRYCRTPIRVEYAQHIGTYTSKSAMESRKPC